MVNMCISQTSPLDIYAACISGWRLINVHQTYCVFCDSREPVEMKSAFAGYLMFSGPEITQTSSKPLKIKLHFKRNGAMGGKKKHVADLPLNIP